MGGREGRVFSFNVALRPQRPTDIHLGFHAAPELRLFFCFFVCLFFVVFFFFFFCLFLKQFGF